MDVEFRTAAAADVGAIVAFGAAVVPAHYTPILGVDAARGQLRWWTPELIAPAAGAGRIWLALADGDVVGVCETGEFDDDQIIWKLYLAPAARGRALGVELVGRALASLPPGTDRVLVEHFAGNTRAAGFYEREGFAVLRTEPAASGDPNAAVVWRRRDLAPGAFS